MAPTIIIIIVNDDDYNDNDVYPVHQHTIDVGHVTEVTGSPGEFKVTEYGIKRV